MKEWKRERKKGKKKTTDRQTEEEWDRDQSMVLDLLRTNGLVKQIICELVLQYIVSNMN